MRVLLAYLSDTGIGEIPIGLSIIQACLRQAGHSTCIFDTTFFKQTDIRSINENLGVHKPVNLEDYGVSLTYSDIDDEFLSVVKNFNPDLIGFFTTSYNFFQVLNMIKLIRRNNINTQVILGGPHTTVAPEESINYPEIDMLCVGEGEEAIIELCKKMQVSNRIDNIENIWIKHDGRVYRNQPRPFICMDKVPCPDADSFSDMHFFKPFSGKVYRMGHIEISRGCPFSCTYCINAYMRNLYKAKNEGNYHREKSIDKAISDIKILVKRHNLEMLRFWDETFLFMKESRLNEFSKRYKKDINLPFIISTHPATINEKRIGIMKDMGCVAISVGIESGNDRIRRALLGRKISNEQIIRAFDIIKSSGIRVTSYNMIGLPFETRKNIFETIDLNRRVKVDTAGPSFFYPYPGTKLREVCLESNFIDSELKPAENNVDTILNMPQIKHKELKGLHKTFTLYIKSPKWLFPLIKLCELDNYISNRIFKFLIRRYC
ncbi:MAG: radical SAM protein [Patescibacteria group bacterium]